MYSVPKEYSIRLHHVRPRFKGDIENVLIYLATEISKIPALPEDDFANAMNEAIRRFPGNSIAVKKTIDNWRTEISSLFGFIENHDGTVTCGTRAKELSDGGDLIEFFKVFLYNFQYPGAHIKANRILELIEAGVRFKPAQYILKLMKFASEQSKHKEYLNKAEVCHCLFNDLRVVRDNENVELVWNRISENRSAEIEYDTKGDVIRYAGDIIDYMVHANLLVTYDNKKYYLNSLEDEAIHKFINSSEWFTGYDKMIEKCSGTLEAINEEKENWFAFVNRKLDDTDFSTDIVALLSVDSNEQKEAVKDAHLSFIESLRSDENTISTKDIGDYGESIVFSHECERLKQNEREDLVHLVKRIPTQLAVGYDISSREIDERIRYIEVKTTVSSTPVQLYRVHLTRNEWNAAETNRDRYFIYRLMLSKTEQKLFIIQDPVGLYKNDKVSMVPTEGADVSFKPDKVGAYEELLAWTS